jgi:hypothetical protein
MAPTDFQQLVLMQLSITELMMERGANIRKTAELSVFQGDIGREVLVQDLWATRDRIKAAEASAKAAEEKARAWQSSFARLQQGMKNLMATDDQRVSRAGLAEPAELARQAVEERAAMRDGMQALLDAAAADQPAEAAE